MALDDWFGLRRNKPVSITIASPGVFTCESHGLKANDKVVFTTTGTLPTGITVDTFYYIIQGTYSDGSIDPDTFKVTASRNGTAINTSSTQTGMHYFSSPIFRGLRSAVANNR